MRRVRDSILANRWPLFLGGILLMSICAQGVLVFVATRPDAPRPIADYYQRALSWDADQSLLAQSQRLGWSVTISVPEGEPFALAERRPVDLFIRDRAGQPVTALTGRLWAQRPADSRHNGQSELVALPHAPGRYRSLARLPVAGVWELGLDAHLGETRFVHSERVVIKKGGQP